MSNKKMIRRFKTLFWIFEIYIQKIFNVKKRKTDEVALFDTSIESENLGDNIICSYCSKVIDEIVPRKCIIRLSTHVMPETEKLEKLPYCTIKIVCGTNLMSPHFEEYSNWKMPRNLKGYQNIITLGVGWGAYCEEISKVSRFVYKQILNVKGLHSVRDNYTEKKFHKMGIHNVVNTGCPTLWGLTPEHCANIPSKKAKAVVTTITDYDQDVKNDQFMIETLLQEYQKVYVWIQGEWDLEYLNELVQLSKITIIERSVEAYTKILDEEDVDYVGTRLHAGIHALNRGVRSIIVAIDNRATEMGKDFLLPIIYREQIEKNLSIMINEETKTEIQLPWDNIQKWKNQFYD